MKTRLLRKLRRKGRNQIQILSVTTESNRTIGMSIAYDDDKYSNLFNYDNTEEEVLKKAERIFIADYIKEKRAEAGRNNEARGLHLHNVISRFRFSLTMIGLALTGIFMMMTFTWTIYWLITGTNFMHDFQKIADNLP